MRTRAGNHVDSSSRAGFEVDGIDPVHRQGWSVLVRGDLVHLDADDVGGYGAAADPGPWLDDRDSWLVLRALDVSGRLLHTRNVEWQLTLRAYKARRRTDLRLCHAPGPVLQDDGDVRRR
jgi:hypothetical protein